MTRVHHFSGLTWVKGEIEELVRKVRDALEEYVEGGGEPRILAPASDHLNQVRGVLEMLQLPGASRLAEETRLSLDALVHDLTPSRQDAAEALMLALIQLPDYLDKLAAGGDDIPLVLLPTINDLRTSRGAQAVNDADLVLAGLSRGPDSSDAVTRRNGVDSLRQAARAARPHFHRALVQWFRDAKSPDGLRALRDLFRDLAEHAAGVPLFRGVFRAAHAVTEGLLDGSIATDRDRKALVGRLDRIIKQVAEDDEGATVDGVGQGLIRDILREVAKAPSGHPVIRAVKADFALEQAFLSDSDLEQARRRLSMPGADALAGVRQAAVKELLPVKDALDLFMRGGQGQARMLRELETPLVRLAGSLEMAGRGDLSRRLRGRAADLKALDDGADVDEALLMRIAGDLIFVESSLDHLSNTPELEGMPGGVPKGEMRSLVVKALRESAVVMAKAKEAIAAFLDNPAEPRVLDPTPALFHEVSGALRVIGRPDAAEILDGVGQFIRRALLERKLSPSPRLLDALADTITGVEYFMEAEVEGRGDLDSILDMARSGLVRLRESVEEAEQSGIAGSAEELPVAEAPLPVQPIAGAVEAEDEQGEPAPGGFGGLDPEILEIFLEEAAEEREVIQEYYSRWRSDPDDAAALTTFRRSFHTLKGSGRLVGATAVGEYAWAVESLLNRVIDQTLRPSDPVLEFLDRAVEALPELIQALAEGREADLDLGALVEQGKALTEARDGAPGGSAIVLPDAEAAGSALPEEEIDDALTVEDSELRDIFETEAREHLQRVDGFVARCSQTGTPCPADESLVRALHTLAGSARMAGVEPIAAVAKRLERKVADCLETGIGLDRVLAGLVGEGAVVIRAMVDALDHREAGLPNIDDLLARIDLYSGPHPAEAHVPVDFELEEEPPVEPISVPTYESYGEDEPAEEIELPGLPEFDELDAFILDQDEAAGASRGDEGGAAAGAAEGLPEEAVPEASFDLGEELPEGVPLEGMEVESAPDLALPTDAGIEEEIPEQVLDLDEVLLEGLPIEGIEAEPTAEQVPSAAETAEEIPEQVPDLGETPFEVIEAEAGAEEEIPAQAGDLDEAPLEAIRAEGAGAEETPGEVAASLRGTAEARPVAARAVAGAPDEEGGLEPLSADAELLEIFLQEAEDLLDQLDIGLSAWDAEPENIQVAAQLQRTLHTLKGSARLAGVQAIGTLSHALETLLVGLTPEQVRGDALLLPLAQRAADRLAEQVEMVRDGGPVRRADALVEELEFARAEISAPTLRKEARAAEPEPESPKAAVSRPSVAKVAPKGEQVRVRGDLLDRLVNNAGEISIYRARLEEQNTALGFNLGELEQTVSRLHEQLRHMEIETEAQILYRYEREGGRSAEQDFDPLELDRFSTIQQLSRSLIESVNDLASIKNLLEDQQRLSETLLLQHSRIINDLQDGLLRTRMVPFGQVVPRLTRLVRQTAHTLHKKADLFVHGAEGQMDRGILERMLAPLEHILRNAVSHGIEPPDGREAAGKDEIGRVSLYLTREGNDVLITVSDDGAGLNLAAIRRRAVEMGLLAPDAQVDDDDVMQLVLEPGFSTVREVTQISGRGVGTDVVVSEVKQLGGTLEIESQPGRGTGFTIRLPFTLAISQALLVEMGEDIYAVPHTTMEGVVRISHTDLGACYRGEQTSFTYAGHEYQVRYLGALLGTVAPHVPEGRKWLPLLLVRSGEHRVAIQVDRILGNRQIVVKSVGPQLASVRWISGGTILADGRVALIMDVSALVRMDAVHAAATAQELAPPKAERQITVLVVDDSITVRKVTTRLLKRHGMEVLTAKDGVDAIALMQDLHPDLMLLDIEMPRMDGYEVARHMRNSDELKDIPIIMITSRTGDKHRNLALSLGVKRYLGKPYQEADLLDNIQDVLADVET